MCCTAHASPGGPVGWLPMFRNKKGQCPFIDVATFFWNSASLINQHYYNQIASNVFIKKLQAMLQEARRIRPNKGG
jgi:hypothetical protein